MIVALREKEGAGEPEVFEKIHTEGNNFESLLTGFLVFCDSFDSGQNLEGISFTFPFSFVRTNVSPCSLFN